MMATRSPFLHAALLQLFGKGDGGAIEAFIGGAVVLIDEQGAVGEGAGDGHHFAQRWRRRFPDAGLDAADDDLVHLQLGAGLGEQRMGLRHRHCGKAGFGRRISLAHDLVLTWQVSIPRRIMGERKDVAVTACRDRRLQRSRLALRSLSLVCSGTKVSHGTGRWATGGSGFSKIRYGIEWRQLMRGIDA